MPGLPQLFVVRNQSGLISLSLCKFVDDILITRSTAAIEDFYTTLSHRFKVGRIQIDSDIVFNDTQIHRNERRDVVYDMTEYFNSVQPICIPRHRRKDSNSACTEAERKLFLTLTGSLNRLGHGVLPKASFAPSYLQQLLSDLTSSLITSNKALGEVKQLTPSAKMLLPISLADPSYLAFSDSIQIKWSYV